MYCPKCGSEYRTGFTICNDCNVRLTNRKPKSIVEQETYAAPSLRIIASILDLIVVGLIISVIYFLNNLITQIDFEENTIEVIFILIYWLYTTFFESSKYKATLGKIVFGFRVVDINFKKITFLRSTVRYVLKLLIGLFTLWQMRYGGDLTLYYDSISETRVVYRHVLSDGPIK